MAAQQDKLSNGIAGVTAASGAQAQTMLDLQQAVTDAQKAYDDLVASGADQDQITAAADKLKQAQTAVTGATKTTQEEFDRLSRIALSSFNTLVASGKSPIEAMNAIGGSIDDLIKDSKAFGLSGNAAFQELSRWRDLTKNNASLLTEIGSLNDLMTATANLGGLTADGFADMQAQGVDAYNQLLAAGFTQQEAETAEKPLLESIIQLHKDKGYAIDDATQKLIDQATKDGVLKDQEMTTNDILMTGFAAIIKAVGGDIPAAFDKFADSGKIAADKVKDAVDKIPSTVPIEVQWSATGSGADPGGAAGHSDVQDPWGRSPVDPDYGKPPDGDTGPKFPSAANEGFFPRPTTVRVGDAPGERGEYVLHASTVDRLLGAWRAFKAPSITMPPFVSDAVAASTATLSASPPLALSAGAGTTTAIIQLDGRTIAKAVVPHTPGEVRRFGLTRSS